MPACGTSQSPQQGLQLPRGGRAYVQGWNARKILAAAGWDIMATPAEADLIWVINRCYLGAYTPSPAAQVCGSVSLSRIHHHTMPFSRVPHMCAHSTEIGKRSLESNPLCGHGCFLVSQGYGSLSLRVWDSLSSILVWGSRCSLAGIWTESIHSMNMYSNRRPQT